MLVAITTDADVPAARARRGPARRHAGHASTASTPTAACRPTTRSRCWPSRRLGHRARRATSSPPRAHRRLRVDLAEQLQEDAEGASHDIAHRGAPARDSEDDAVEVGRSVARNNLFKAAVFGNDPNWGRVLAADRHHATLRSTRTTSTSSMNGVRVCHARAAPIGRATQVDLHAATATHVLIELNAGEAHRDHPHQRPHARLRAREQRLRELHDRRRRHEGRRRGDGPPAARC